MKRADVDKLPAGTVLNATSQYDHHNYVLTGETREHPDRRWNGRKYADVVKHQYLVRRVGDPSKTVLSKEAREFAGIVRTMRGDDWVIATEDEVLADIERARRSATERAEQNDAAIDALEKALVACGVLPDSAWRRVSSSGPSHSSVRVSLDNEQALKLAATLNGEPTS